MELKPHILVVEDNPADFELMQHELRKGELSFTSKRVDADDELFLELKQHPPDVILSDNALANADSLTVLRLVRDRCPDTPCILVTGGMKQEKLAEAFEHGADDCVFKQHLSELVPAVHRALRLVGERRRLRLAEFERDQLRAELAAMRGERLSFAPLVTLCRSCRKVRNKEGEWEPIEMHFLRHYGIGFTYNLCQNCVQTFYTGHL